MKQTVNGQDDVGDNPMQKRRTVSFLMAVMLLAATLCNTVPLDAFATPLAETAEVSGEADKADAIKKLPGVDNADGNARGASDDADTDSMDEGDGDGELRGEWG